MKQLLEFAGKHYAKFTILGVSIFLIEWLGMSWFLSFGNIDLIVRVLIIGLQVAAILNLISLVGLIYNWYVKNKRI